MKILIIVLIFISGISYAQDNIFRLENYKGYEIYINGIKDVAQADYIARNMEKMNISIFSYVDAVSGTGYFIVDNFYKVHEIEKQVNNIAGLSYNGNKEFNLTDDSFLEIYMKRGGYEKTEFSINKPKQIIMGPFEDLTSSLYRKALNVWEKTYANAYSNKLKGLPEHCPVFVNTGNPENDNLKYDKAKQEWIKNYPDEVEKMTGRSYQSATGMESPKDIEKKNSINK